MFLLKKYLTFLFLSSIFILTRLVEFYPFTKIGKENTNVYADENEQNEINYHG